MADADRRFHVGVDIGGTFTDLVAVDPDGVAHRAKALTSGAARGTLGERAGLLYH
jgi:N-methylhydantoinase A/oxoprolinase/acetone carboxylase beta subunit